MSRLREEIQINYSITDLALILKRLTCLNFSYHKSRSSLRTFWREEPTVKQSSSIQRIAKEKKIANLFFLLTIRFSIQQAIFYCVNRHREIRFLAFGQFHGVAHRCCFRNGQWFWIQLVICIGVEWVIFYLCNRMYEFGCLQSSQFYRLSSLKHQNIWRCVKKWKMEKNSQGDFEMFYENNDKNERKILIFSFTLATPPWNEFSYLSRCEFRHIFYHK